MASNNRNWMPKVDEIYTGEVIDVNKHGVVVQLKGFGSRRGRKDLTGILHKTDSPIVNNLIEGNKVKVRVISCSSDGFISITAKDIEQPINKNEAKKNVLDADYEKQKRKIRVVSPERNVIKQCTTPSAIGIEVITTEPNFLKNIDYRMSSKIPTNIPIFKNEYSTMALVAKQKNKNIQPGQVSFQQSSFSYEWVNPKIVTSKQSNANLNQKQQLPMIQRNKMTITEQRQSLPIFSYREDIIRAVTNNQFLIVQAETGSGKTTQLPQYLIEGGFIIKGKVACTQPRRVAAVSVAKRVADEYGCIIGQEVGYKIRYDDVTSSSTIIKYMTDGILLRECLSDKTLDSYSVIILDEAHERTIYTDVLFGILKEAAKKRPSLRVVISSATLNAQKFSKYFNDAKILTIPGSMFPVEIKFRASPEHDYFNAAINTVLNIHLREPAGDILCFLTGQDEIERAYDIIEEKACSNEFSNLFAFPIYSAMPFEEQSEIFTPTQRGQRKVIFATNIAETSMTIDGIVYVVDPGFVKQKIYDAKTGIESLMIIPISKASADQRSGRAGRISPGKCYRIYTEQAYLTEMLDSTVPEIQRSNLSNVILHLKSIGVGDILNFDFLDPPPRSSLVSALKELYLLDALDEDGKITTIGQKMNRFPIDPNYAKMLLLSEDMKCSDEIITIIAMLSVPNIFYRPKKQQALADERKNIFNHAVGDHLRLLNVYNKWEMNYTNPNWCKNHYLNENKLYEAYEVRKNLLSILESRGVEIFSAGKNISRIQMAICAGFFKNIARKDSETIFSRGTVKSYKTLDKNPETVFIHPSSCLFQLPKWVVFNNIRETSKKFLQDITVIDPQWLPIVAKRMYRSTGVERNDCDDLLALLNTIQRLNL
ncbi:hypothetical protein PVAND_000665 [Polypedilum vanderplanki]|uniref:RNA helicase n=1 Tax=Polypedilum vanderplanki TaxID=319348 RepID=A0A9J6BKV1_POLVA|nr:hypothetical protein PVAND_000665 [Polypedilum vanderplanki]